jgi:hypothetical protein
MRRLPVSLNYATHLPALMRALERSGYCWILEMGMGVFSTPFLHYESWVRGWPLFSYDNDTEWAKFFIAQGYSDYPHEIRIVTDWDKADLGHEWGVALVDHSPGSRRRVDIARLAHNAHYIVAHDANGRYDKEYRYSEVYPLFKYKTVWDAEARHTVVLSNFHDLGDFWA